MISVATKEVPNNLSKSNSQQQHINDNYSVPPTRLSRSFQGLDLVMRQSHQEQNISCLNSNQNVSCINVVSPVLSATIPGQPQKKGIRIESNKACQRCFLCRSLSFCPLCSKCPTCCHRNRCWGKIPELLASLAKVEFKSQGSFPSEGRLLSSFQGKATSQLLSLDCEQICKPLQKQGPGRSSVVPKTKASSGKGGCQVLTGFLQPTLPGPKTQRAMAPNLGSKPTQSLPVNKQVQDGNSGDNLVVSSAGGMGHFARLQRLLLSHSHSPEIQEVSKISPEQDHLPLYFPSLWSGNGPVGIHQSGQGGQTNGSSKGYQDPPVPRRLVATSPFPGNMPTAYPDPLGPMSRAGLAGKHAEVRAGAPTGFQLCWLPVRPFDRSGVTH